MKKTEIGRSPPPDDHGNGDGVEGSGVEQVATWEHSDESDSDGGPLQASPSLQPRTMSNSPGNSSSFESGKRANEKPRADGVFYRILMHRRCTRGCIMSCPRFWVFLFGVVGPLWMLIVLSCFFGYGLGKLEAQVEYDQNDEFLASRWTAGMTLMSALDYSQLSDEECTGHLF